MGITIALTNQKGGVGKTTISWGMAVSLAERYGKKVLVVDLDTQGNISHTLIKETKDGVTYDVLNYNGLQAKELFDPAVDLKVLKPMHATHKVDLVYTEPNDQTLVRCVTQPLDGSDRYTAEEAMNAFTHNMETLASEYDFVIIDCPPQLGDHVLGALVASNYVITPVQPTAFVIDGTKGFFENLTVIGREQAFLGLALNNIDRNQSRHRAMAQELKEALQGKIFNSILYHRGPFDAAIYQNTPLYAQLAWRVAAVEFDNFLREVISKISQKENITIELNDQLTAAQEEK